MEARITRRGRLGIEFEAITTYDPTTPDLRRFQNGLGYCALGYGGPWGVVRERLTDGRYRTTWECARSCD